MRPAGVDVAFLTKKSDIGISRNQGTLRFDGAGILLEPLKRAGFPTFLNGVLVDQATTSIVLAHGDLLGFGGAGSIPSDVTVTVRADLAELGVPPRVSDADRMPPPPARAPAAVGAAAAQGEGTDEVTAGEKRARGERGGSKSKKARLAADDAGGGASAPTTAAPVDAVYAQNAALVEPLKGEAKRWARRMLEQLDTARGRLLGAIDDGAADPAVALDALGRVARGCSGALRDLADDIDRADKRARVDTERADARHAQHDQRQGRNGPAASHAGDRHVWFAGGKGGGGKGGGGKGGHGGKGGGGKGGRHGGEGGGRGGKGGGRGGGRS